ncbi:MAG: hypothetical protein IKV72_00005, partial [Firmicutes bacterium]|nr:hypothetical protein [Bacillota bacterium]
MIIVKSYNKVICILIVLFMVTCITLCSQEPVYASAVNKENLVTDSGNPSNGVIKYRVMVPAGEKVDYSVTLTPDKINGKKDTVKGSYQNKTRKTVYKTVSMKVNYFTNKYKIKASYSKKTYGSEIIYKDTDSVTSALKTSVVTAKFKWDFSELGKGQKDWKYRYKYVPYDKGFKKYVQVFDAKGKQIKN